MSKHRFLTHRLLSVAVLGASLTLLAACGSTAADLESKGTERDEGLPDLQDFGQTAALSIDNLSLPGGTENPALTTQTPFVSGEDDFQAGKIAKFTATALHQGVGSNSAGEARGVTSRATTTSTQHFAFSPLRVTFYPTVANIDETTDVPFLLIWQFADAVTEGSPNDGGGNSVANNGKFIAPGIGRFDYQPDEAITNYNPPDSRAHYLEHMLDQYKPSTKLLDEIGTTEKESRPIPYAGLTDLDAIPGNGKMARVLLTGSSTYWSSDLDDAVDDAEDDDANPEIPLYDVELIFPKRKNGKTWALKYSGFILMRAFYKGDRSNLATDAPLSYINLFTYTSDDNPTDTQPMLKAYFEAEGNEDKSQIQGIYKSAFSAWGVARGNTNQHHYLFHNDFTLIARFKKGGGGTLEGSIGSKEQPIQYSTSGGTPSTFKTLTAPVDWLGQSLRLKDVTWKGYSGEGIQFEGEVVVTGEPLADTYVGDGESAIKGTFAGSRAEELVAEIKLKPKSSGSTATDVTYLGGVSGQRYAPDTTQ